MSNIDSLVYLWVRSRFAIFPVIVISPTEQRQINESRYFKEVTYMTLNLLRLRNLQLVRCDERLMLQSEIIYLLSHTLCQTGKK